MNHKSHAPWLQLAAVSIALVSCGGGAASDAARATDGEVFALADPGDGAATHQAYLAKSSVTGLAYRTLWKTVEPSDGSYDWSGVDGALSSAQAANKKLTIHVGVSGGAWPGWLTAAGAQTYSGATPVGTVTDPIPWDAIFLARYARFVKALADHIQANQQTGFVRSVSVGAPVAEMSLVSCSASMLSSAIAYDRTQYLNAWAGAASSVATAFPAAAVFVSAPVSTICRPDSDGAAFFSDLMTPLTQQHAKLSVFAADLNAAGSQRLNQVTGSLRALPIGLQTIGSATNDPSNRMAGSLSSAVCAGRSAGARYFEIYKADLDSSDAAIVAAIQQARGERSCP